jgi:DNA-binding transcriptional LysR family regulator
MELIDPGGFRVETQDISLFLSIARIGSISKTAEQLFMSQSTVTTRLQRLEKALGYTLFNRTPNGVQLTPEGERLVPLAERMVALEERMITPDRTHAPILRVMSGRAFVSTDVPNCLSLMLKYVNVHWKVRMGLYDTMMDALLANQVDFCFLGEPIYHPSVTLIEFTPDKIDLVVPKNHHFVHHFPGIHALQTEPFIAFGRSTAPFRQRVLNLLAKSNVYPSIRMELDSIDGIKAMVSKGLGVSFLPRRTLHDADVKGIVAIPMKEPGWTRPTFLAHPQANADKPLTKQFIQVVEQYYKSLR